MTFQSLPRCNDPRECFAKTPDGRCESLSETYPIGKSCFSASPREMLTQSRRSRTWIVTKRSTISTRTRASPLPKSQRLTDCPTRMSARSWRTNGANTAFRRTRSHLQKRSASRHRRTSWWSRDLRRQRSPNRLAVQSQLSHDGSGKERSDDAILRRLIYWRIHIILRVGDPDREQGR